MERLYRGYLMANLATRLHTNDFICVDENAEAVDGAEFGDQESGELYPVEAEFPPESSYVHSALAGVLSWIGGSPWLTGPLRPRVELRRVCAARLIEVAEQKISLYSCPGLYCVLV
jgi:hypothetical protein